MHDYNHERRRHREPADNEPAANGDAQSGAVTMDPRVAFAARWAPHGGGAPQNIRDLFGCSVPGFHRQVLTLLDASDAGGVGGVSGAVGVRVEAVARRRLWLGR